ncbi:hypothetical protein K438DRAFT_1749483 [Mycena galopus ATCC 62051]|nr:hypothetical protein K438DRAFT_1749483 [Mycena galopus ATCC 62051]
MHTTALKALGSEWRALMPVVKHPYNPKFVGHRGESTYLKEFAALPPAPISFTYARRKQPRRRKYHGQFEACSSLLGEYHTIPEPVQLPTGPGLYGRCNLSDLARDCVNVGDNGAVDERWP